MYLYICFFFHCHYFFNLNLGLSRQVEREDNLNGNHCQENVETKKQKSVPKTGLKRYRNEIEAKNGDDNNDNLSDFSEVICNLHVMPQMAYG